LSVPRSNLTIRIATAVVAFPLLLWAIFGCPPWVWYLIVVTAVVVGTLELFAMTHPGDRVAQGIGAATALGVSLSLYFFASDARVVLTLLLAVPVLGMLIPLWRLGDIPTAGLRMMAGIAGPLYLGGLLTTSGMLRRDLGSSGAGYVLFSLGIAWLADTGGYFFGRFLGRAKLYAAVSPKKTQAGFVGALFGAMLAALGARSWLLPHIPLGAALCLGLLAGALGQLGDLSESLLKRSTGNKDSGWILPGHGGLLDRIDALLIVSPIVYGYAIWFDHG
jgi:phosphatidate cytidylyltransferase